MTYQYVNYHIDPSGDSYIPQAELMSSILIRIVNNPSTLEFIVSNPAGALNATYELDDIVEAHVGTEPLYQWGSLSAAILDGVDEDITIAHAASLNIGTDDFTIAFRIKTTDASVTLIEKVDDPTADAGFAIVLDASGKIKAHCNDGVDNETASSNTAVNDGFWHFILISFDKSGNATFYLDNTADGTFDISNVDTVNNGEDIIIGSTGAAAFYDGIIDEVIITNDLWSSGERLAYYALSTAPSNNKIGIWTMNDGYGSTATDTSGNSNDGTLAATDMWQNPKVYTGLLNEIEIVRSSYGENIMTCRSQDFLTVLGARLARKSYPGAVDVSTVLTNLISDFASGEYSTTNVDATGTNVNDFTIGTQKNLLSVMRQLADMPSGDSFDFYLDGNNDINWHKRGSTDYDSGITIDGDNIRKFSSRRSTRDKKTSIVIRNAFGEEEDLTLSHGVVTDSVTLDAYNYADDFVANWEVLMKISLNIQKIGTPGADLTGRIAISKYESPQGDFKVFSVREEDISTDQAWVDIPLLMSTQPGTRYWIKLDKVGANSSNTYKWYNDAPAVIDTVTQSKRATGLIWDTYNADMSMKLYKGLPTEVSATDAETPKREAALTLDRILPEGISTSLATRLLANYLQTQWQVSADIDVPTVVLNPGELITLNETGSGLASKKYRMDKIKWEFGKLRRTNQNTLQLSSELPFESIDNILSKLLDTEIGKGATPLGDGTAEEVTPSVVDLAVTGRTYAGYNPGAVS